MGYSIAIDGPAGAGKSTIAKKVAAKKAAAMDTGAIYRANGIFLLENGVKGKKPTESQKMSGGETSGSHMRQANSRYF